MPDPQSLKSDMFKDEILEKYPSAGMETVFNWDYDLDWDKLRSLYAKAKEDQWNADTNINWEVDVDPAITLGAEFVSIDDTKFWKTLSTSQQERFSANTAAFALSQILHGEQGAMMVAGQLITVVPDQEAKLYASTQAYDEARHVEVFTRYVERLDRIYPVHPAARELLGLIMQQKHWVGMLVGMQMILEGIALSLFVNARKTTRDPLLRDLLDLVIKDEARHVAYGNVYVKEVIRDLPEEERRELENFSLDALLFARKYQMGILTSPDFKDVLINADIDPQDFFNGIVKEMQGGWKPLDAMAAAEVNMFKQVMMPQLKNVGLIESDDIKARYEKERMRISDDMSFLSTLETNLVGLS